MHRSDVRERDCRVFQSPYRYRFLTGYTANLGVISALADHNAVGYWMPTATPVFMTPVLSAARDYSFPP